MKHRVKLGKNLSRRIFRAGASTVKKVNVLPPVSRGGIRL